jgi:adiponectin receptor
MSTTRRRGAASCTSSAEPARPRTARRGPFTLPNAKDGGNGTRASCSSWFCAVCDIEDAPEWMVFNPYVRGGYRVGARWLGATRSIFMVHNETVNIWSHLIGFVLFAMLLVRTFFTAHSGIGLETPPAGWVTGADVARVERIEYATRWRQAIEKDRIDIRRIDENMRMDLDESTLGNLMNDVGYVLVNVTHELAEHLRSGEEAFKVENRRKVLKRSLDGAQKVLSVIEDHKHDEQYGKVVVHAGLLKEKLNVLRAHIKNVPDDPEPAKPAKRWPVYVFLVGAMVCLLFSTICHTYCCVGFEEGAQMWRLDYFGIAALIVTSFYPIVYYSFYCLPKWRRMYLSGITTLGCLAVIPTFLRRFQDKNYAPLRAGLFVALGLMGVFPIFQQVFFVWHIVPTPVEEAFLYQLFMAFCYLFGAYLYAYTIPERWSPGNFDIIGCSHNIFHLLVVVAAYSHYRATMIYLTWRDHYTCEADHQLLLNWYHMADHFRNPDVIA